MSFEDTHAFECWAFGKDVWLGYKLLEKDWHDLCEAWNDRHWHKDIFSLGMNDFPDYVWPKMLEVYRKQNENSNTNGAATTTALSDIPYEPK